MPFKSTFKSTTQQHRNQFPNFHSPRNALFNFVHLSWKRRPRRQLHYSIKKCRFRNHVRPRFWILYSYFIWPIRSRYIFNAQCLLVIVSATLQWHTCQHNVSIKSTESNSTVLGAYFTRTRKRWKIARHNGLFNLV